MFYIAYYDPFVDYFVIERFWDWSGKEGNSLAHIISQGRITRYSITSRTIVVKPRNFLIFTLPPDYPSDFYPLCTLLHALWLNGSLHSFDFSDHPELFI